MEDQKTDLLLPFVDLPFDRLEAVDHQLFGVLLQLNLHVLHKWHRFTKKDEGNFTLGEIVTQICVADPLCCTWTTSSSWRG